MKRPAFALLALCMAAPSALAAPREELVDENGDGRKETRVWTENGRKTRSESDRDGDGRFERTLQYDAEGKKQRAEEDRDGDGAIDVWTHYGKGFVREAKDTNKDGRPDEITTRMKGRLILLKEYDRNFDGLVDKRKWSEWGSRRLAPGQPEVPGYQTMWREEDDDFDGRIDHAFVKGDAAAAKAKIGKPMEGAPYRSAEERAKEAAAAGPGPGPNERRVKSMNEKFGTKERDF